MPEILLAFDPAAPPENPVPVGADQLYVVPESKTSPPPGVTEKLELAHTVAVLSAIVDFGLTVTVTENTPLVQPLAVAVTEYTAVCAVVPLFTNVPKILVWPVALTPPVILLPIVGADQLYVVPTGTTSDPFVGKTEKAVPPQTVAVLLAINGTGFEIN